MIQSLIFKRKQKSQTLIETAMILPLLLFVFFLLIAAGFWMIESASINGALNVDILPVISNQNPATVNTALSNAEETLRPGLFDSTIQTVSNIGSPPTLCPNANPPAGKTIICVNVNQPVNGNPGYAEMGVWAHPNGFIIPGTTWFTFPIKDIVWVKQEVFYQ